MTRATTTNAQTALRRIAPVGAMLVAFVLIGAAAGWLFVKSPASPSSQSVPTDRRVAWYLGNPLYGTRFDPTTAQTTTEIWVTVPEPACASSKGFPRDTWLAPPEITYTPSAVTITMYTSEAFEKFPGCYDTVNGRRGISYILDVYIDVPVHLSEPLRGRELLGSSNP